LTFSSLVVFSEAIDIKCLDDCHSGAAAALLNGVKAYLTTMNEYFPAGLAETCNLEARQALLAVPFRLSFKSELLFTAANAQVQPNSHVLPSNSGAHGKQFDITDNSGLVQCRPEEIQVNFAKMWSALERAECNLAELAQCQRLTRCRALKYVFQKTQDDYLQATLAFRNGLVACKSAVPLLSQGWNAITEKLAIAAVPGCPEAKTVQAGQIYAHAARQVSAFGHAEATAAIQPCFCCDYQLERGLIASTALETAAQFLEDASALLPLVSTKAAELAELAEKSAPIANDFRQCNCQERLRLHARQSCLNLDTVDSALKDLYTANTKRQCDNLKLVIYAAIPEARSIKDDTYYTIRACIPCGVSNVQ